MSEVKIPREALSSESAYACVQCECGKYVDVRGPDRPGHCACGRTYRMEVAIYMRHKESEHA